MYVCVRITTRNTKYNEHMELSEQEVIRRESLQKMKDMGINPYPADEYVVTGYSTDIKTSFVDLDPEADSASVDADWYTGKPVRIAGRLMSRRIMGKASFIELQDSKGRLLTYLPILLRSKCCIYYHAIQMHHRNLHLHALLQKPLKKTYHH